MIFKFNSFIVCNLLFKQEPLGKDHLGKMRNCVEMPADTICTREMTEADYYTNDCREQGKIVVQCGCHDYICFEKEN